MVLGSYIAYTNTRILGLPIFLGFPMALILCSIITLVISISVIEPLLKRERTPVLITLATVGVGIVIESLIMIYNTWIKDFIKTPTSIMLREYEFYFGELSGTFILSSLFALGSILVIRFILNQTRLGISIKTMNEDPELVQIQGMDPVKVRIITWMIAGGLTGLAGSLLVIRFHVTVTLGLAIMSSIFAASLLGGIDNPKGALFGGFIIGVSEILLISLGQSLIDPWIGEWRPLIPLVFLVIVLRYRPQGFLGIDSPHIFQSERKALSQNKFVLVFAVLVIGGIFFFTICRHNLIKTQDGLMAEFSEFDLVVAEMDRSVSVFIVGDLALFKKRLIEYDITTVYVEPYSDLDRHFTFYYIRMNKYYKTHVTIQSCGLCQYKIQE